MRCISAIKASNHLASKGNVDGLTGQHTKHLPGADDKPYPDPIGDGLRQSQEAQKILDAKFAKIGKRPGQID